jgi:transposase
MEAASSPAPEAFEALRAGLALAKAEAAKVKAINADLETRNALFDLQYEKMRRVLYGQRSERARQLIGQPDLGYEELEDSATRTRPW